MEQDNHVFVDENNAHCAVMSSQKLANHYKGSFEQNAYTLARVCLQMGMQSIYC